jgi:uncharacterized GH25 family protein
MHTTTAANGSYSVTHSESVQGTYTEQVNFYGNANYLGSSEMIFLSVGNLVPTTISVNVTNSNPGVNQPFTFSGHLTDVNGTPLSGRTIVVNLMLPNGDWNMTAGSPTTDSNGYFSVTYSEPTGGQYHFEFHFMGDTVYAQSGPGVEVAVGTLQPTNLSMKASVTNPSANQPFTLSGYLTDANGTPLSGKEILLGRTVVGQPTNSGDGGTYDHRYTDQNGYYSFVLNESAGTYWYGVYFMGDQTYATSNTVFMKLTVGTRTPTTLTVTASTTTPAVNKPFTLSGTLTANGTPLSGKTIRLEREDPSGKWQQAVKTTTTDANGAYTFTWSESAQGLYHYQPTFDGAGAYALSYALISINV